MGTNLHQLLRSLCLDTDWNYAIFWKLQHCTRMTLTWEDAYYDNLDNCDSSQSMFCEKTLEKICSGDFSHDPLGLSLAKMSYHVYLLGEGIVGQVAVTGKHQWISADNHVTSSDPSFKFADGWHSQFSAGIRTIAVVAVAPLGVVQLGSLNEVSQDMGLVTNIRSLILSSHDHTLGYLPSQIESVNPNTQKTTTSETREMSVPFLCPGKNYSPHVVYQEMIANAAKHEGREINSDQSSISLQSMSNMMFAENQKSNKNISSFLHNSVMENNSANDLTSPPENVIADTEMSKFHTESCYGDSSYTMKFPAGYELHEALGPGFLKESKYFDWAVHGNQDSKSAEMSDEISCSQLTSESHPEHLLEAVVTKFCHSNNIVNNELSFSTSVQDAMVNSGRNPEVSIHNVHTINSEGYYQRTPRVKEDKHHSLSSSGICGVISPKSMSSCPSSCSNQFERSSEPSKNIKKRARPGESCRPRPRDRQLIQDRIKELRELVPNGAKCSIDSLLECTIKHMLFLQSVTKHADKLNKFAEKKTKLHHIEKDIHGSSDYQQGSSWAMEVGGHLKVCSILVENLSKNGRMLVEMLCEECSHFLEIAEAIRSLELTILNGTTEARGEKTCICFVVEGKNNRNLHRLDILWPLVHLLQSKSTMHS